MGEVAGRVADVAAGTTAASLYFTAHILLKRSGFAVPS